VCREAGAWFKTTAFQARRFQSALAETCGWRFSPPSANPPALGGGCLVCCTQTQRDFALFYS